MSVRQDPLLSHPLAATPNTAAEPTLRTAFASVSPPQSPRNTLPPPSPLRHVPSPRSVLNEGPFISRRRSNLLSPPRVIRSSPGADDPLSGALSSLGPSAVARPPAADTAYATSISNILIRERSMENSATIKIHQHGATALISSHTTNDAIAKGQVTEIQLRPGNNAGMFIIETWRDDSGALESDENTLKSYAILSSASSTGASECIQVMRSIADFVWLEGRLRAKYDGVIVPHLPPMALKGRLLYGFAYETERLRGLHRFVSLLVSHPLLAHVDETLAFLGDRGSNTWKLVRRRPLEHTRTFVAVQNDENAGTGGILRQWGAFRVWQAGRRINRGVGSFLNRDVSQNNTEHLSAEEKALERLQSYVRDLRTSLHETRNAAKEAAEASSNCVDKYGHVQRALRAFGVKEGGIFGDLLRTITLVNEESVGVGEVRSEESSTGHTAGTVTGLGVERTADQVLDDVLMDYETRAVSAARLVQLRCDEREAYEYAAENYSSLRERWEASTSSVWDNNNNNSNGNGNEIDTSELRELHTKLATAADTLAKAQRQYQLVDRSTNDELRRLRTHLHGELLLALRAVAAERVQVHTQMRDAWIQLAARIDETSSADQEA